jgi:hypothetical protein
MSLIKRRRVLAVCVVLQVGVFAGVPMLPDDIRELMAQINRTAVARVLPAGNEDDNEKYLWTVLLTMMIPSGSMDATGAWRVVARFDEPSVARGAPARADLVCTFAQRNAGLTGECRPADGPDGVPVRGSVNGDSIVWSFDIAINDAERKEPVTFTGTAEENGASIAGTLAMGELRGAFTARRE